METTSEKSGPRVPRPKVDSERIDLRRLSAECERGAFSCGHAHIDHFFRTFSLDEHQNLACRVVTAHLDASPDVAGFAAVRITSELATEFDGKRTFFLNPGRISTIDLMWLGVSSPLQRQGIGSTLMNRVFDDFVEIADRAGVTTLTVLPINQSAYDFYISLGFQAYGTERRMFLPVEPLLELKMKIMLDNGE